MNLDWSQVRPINGSMNNGFEELVCQLARVETIPQGGRFIRKGAPDAGVECFWKLPNNDEWAWQAKYFLNSLNASNWAQIDKSVRAALEGHANLKKYYIAIPINPSDSRLPRQISLQQKWNSRVKVWQSWAKKKRMKVDFLPWWATDLIKIIHRKENLGFIKFWFNKEYLSDDWFLKRNANALRNLGPRYTPELNIKLEISHVFHSMRQNKEFKNLISEAFHEVVLKVRKLHSRSNSSSPPTFSAKLRAFTDFIELKNHELLEANHESYDFEEILKRIIELKSEIDKFYDSVKESREDKIQGATREPIISRSEYLELISEFQDLESKLEGVPAKLFNVPYLLLDGEAGSGKSHLFGDAINCIGDAKPDSLLLLGQHFTVNATPQIQILQQLDLNCTFDEFMESLTCRAISNNNRIILFIDALNEGSGKKLWTNFLSGFIAGLAAYKWIGLALSVRTSYLELFTNALGVEYSRMVRATHFGFAEFEFNAMKIFFQYYGIELPRIPNFHIEFRNPLFLKLFCQGLRSEGLTSVPDGLDGIARIFDFYINSINKKLSSATEYDYIPELNIVKAILHKLVNEKLESGESFVSIERAVELSAEIMKRNNLHGNIIDSLLSEGLLMQDYGGTGSEGISIGYERLEDHLIVSALFNDRSRNDIEAEFQSGGAFFDFISDAMSLRANSGIIEALAVILPERYGLEVFEVLDSAKANSTVVEAFIKSLNWRSKPVRERQVCTAYINEFILKQEHYHSMFWDSVISGCASNNFPFNAKWLHIHLSQQSLPDRDAAWTQIITNQFQNRNTIKNLLDWAWTKNSNSQFSSDSIEMVGILITWFFVSPNRLLRDSATKALICLLEGRFVVLQSLLKAFSDCNDLYVVDRLYAVAYGVAVRWLSKKELKGLSEYIYETIFSDDPVVPHVLIRDYARGIIEYAIASGVEISGNMKKIRPPHRSMFPKIPSDSKIEKLCAKARLPGRPDVNYALDELVHSIEVEHRRDGNPHMYGDFGRYVFQSSFSDWNQLNPNDLRNIAIQRIFQMGYDVKKHGAFDRHQSNGSRHSHTKERLGKKYQWLAFYELLAQVGDNFKLNSLHSRYGEEIKVNYSGPWHPYVRNIDPSVILRQDEKIGEIGQDFRNSVKWGKSRTEWLKSISGLPEPTRILETADSQYFRLEGTIRYSEKGKFGVDKYAEPRRQFWMIIKSFICHNRDYTKILNWLGRQDLSSLDLPDLGNRYQIFNREFYWSLAFKEFQIPYYQGSDFSPLRDYRTNKKIADIAPTAQLYLWENEYDYSKSDTIKIMKPCSVISGNLTHGSSEDSLYFGADLISYNESDLGDNMPALVFKKQYLLNLLESKRMKIFWIIRAEKNTIGGEHSTEKKYKAPPQGTGVFTLEKGKIVGKLKTHRRT